MGSETQAANRNGCIALLLFILWFVLEMAILIFVHINGETDWKAVVVAGSASTVPAILGLAYLRTASRQLADETWKYSCACAYIIVAGITVPAILAVCDL